jgi:hypothetical protein
VAYRLKLPLDSTIHLVFHVSQLKPFHPDHTLVFSSMPDLTDLEAIAVVPDQILDRRLIKKGNHAIPQVLITWTGLSKDVATWKDYHVVKTRFPKAPAWGQAASSVRGDVTAHG